MRAKTTLLAAVLSLLVACAVAAEKPAPAKPKSSAGPKSSAKSGLSKEAKKKQMQAVYEKGMKLYKEGKYAECINELDKIKKAGVSLGWWTDMKVNNTLESAYEKLMKAKREAAKKAEEQKRKAKENEMRALLKQGVKLCKEKKYVESVQVLEKVKKSGVDLGFWDNMKLNSTLAKARDRQAEAEKKAAKAKREAAKKAEEQARKAKEKEMRALFERGIKLYKEKKYTESVEVLEKVKKSGVDLGWWDNMKLNNTLGEARRKKARVVKRVLKAKPQPPKKAAPVKAKPKTKKAEMLALYEQGIALYKEKKYAESIDALEKVKQSGVDLGWWANSNCSNTLENARHKLMEIKKKEAEERRKAQKEEMLKLYSQGLAYYEQGKYREAVIALDKVIESGVDIGLFEAIKLRDTRTKALAAAKQITAGEKPAPPKVAKAAPAAPAKPAPTKPPAAKAAPAKPAVTKPAAKPAAKPKAPAKPAPKKPAVTKPAAKPVPPPAKPEAKPKAPVKPKAPAKVKRPAKPKVPAAPPVVKPKPVEARVPVHIFGIEVLPDPVTTPDNVRAESAGRKALRVARVVPGSDAEAVGIQRGDLIYKLNGKDVKSIDALVDILGDMRPDEEGCVELLRGRQTIIAKFAVAPTFVETSSFLFLWTEKSNIYVTRWWFCGPVIFSKKTTNGAYEESSFLGPLFFYHKRHGQRNLLGTLLVIWIPWGKETPVTF